MKKYNIYFVGPLNLSPQFEYARPPIPDITRKTL